VAVFVPSPEFVWPCCFGVASKVAWGFGVQFGWFDWLGASGLVSGRAVGLHRLLGLRVAKRRCGGSGVLSF